MSKSSQSKAHYDIYCKRRGYICSVASYDATMETLKSLFNEHGKHFRKLASTGRNVPSFACYGVERIGNTGRKITYVPVSQDDEDEYMSYEDVVNE